MACYGPPLSRGVLREMHLGATGLRPVVQVVAITPLDKAVTIPDVDSNGLALSDGESMTLVVMSTAVAAAHGVARDGVKLLSVVRVEECAPARALRCRSASWTRMTKQRHRHASEPAHFRSAAIRCTHTRITSASVRPLQSHAERCLSRPHRVVRLTLTPRHVGASTGWCA
jgi:hypothetical protein